MTENESPDAGDRRWLTVNEAARIAGIGRTLAYDAIRRNEIPSFRLGRHIRVPKKAFLAMLDGDGLTLNAEKQ